MDVLRADRVTFAMIGVLVFLAALAFFGGDDDGQAAGDGLGDDWRAAPAGALEVGRGGSGVGDERSDDDGVPASDEGVTAADEARRERRRQVAGALREAIRQARELRTSPAVGAEAAAEAPAAEVSAPEPVGRLEAEYIQDAVREIRPLLAECYEQALEHEPGLEGRLVIEFDIEGEPEVGGVVNDSRVSDESEIAETSLDECVTETLYTLELPAPEGGGRVHVRYPFLFAAAEDTGGGDPAAE